MAAKRSIFDEGAVLVPEVLDAGAARKTLAAIDTGPWSTEIGRRVQHYGYRYSYSGRAAQPTPTTPFPPWAEVLGGAVARHFGRQPTQCIVNEYEPGQGIGMHADAPTFGPVIVSVTLGSAWEMRFRAPGVRPYSRDGLDDDEKGAAPRGLRAGADRRSALALDARHLPSGEPGRTGPASIGDVPDAGVTAGSTLGG